MEKSPSLMALACLLKTLSAYKVRAGRILPPALKMVNGYGFWLWQDRLELTKCTALFVFV